MSRILIVAEHDGATLNPSTAKCVNCAAGFASDGADVVVLGSGSGAVAEQAAGIQGVNRVRTLDRPENAHPVAAVLAPQVAALGHDYDYVLGPYKEFLAGKSTFVLTAKPAEPINLSQIDLYKPADVPALLNLSGEAL